MNMQRIIASLTVVSAVVTMTALNNIQVGNAMQFVGLNLVDSNRHDTLEQKKIDAKMDSADTQRKDTARMTSATDSLLNALDSIKSKFDNEHGITNEGNKKATQWNDSVAAAEDSINKHKKKSALEAPVTYEAKDSMTMFMDTKNAYLYGEANVKYQNIELNSENITMNMDSSIVHAVYGLDTLGNKIGLPVFKEGSQEYKSETMSYNFDTKKG